MSSSSGKLKPNLDKQGTKALNLSVLQRIDPSIQHIIYTVTHVTFYKFNILTNQWAFKDVEGSLFLVKRNIEPWFHFIVMNRLNTDNLVENLLDFEYEVQVPYLLYKNASQEVNGIWFYDPRECEEVANLFNQIIKSIATIPSKPLESAPAMVVMEGPVEPLPVSGTTESTSFSNFFNAATNLGNNVSLSGNPSQSHHPASVLTSSVGTSSLLPVLLPSRQVQSTAASAPPVPLARQPDVSDSMNRNHLITNLVKPSIFLSPHSLASAVPTQPASSFTPTVAPQSTLNLQSPYGAPLLQPFPPPGPSSSLTPNSASILTYARTIDRDKVRQAFLMLVQDNQFIDMVCKALQQVNHV